MFAYIFIGVLHVLMDHSCGWSPINTKLLIEFCVYFQKLVIDRSWMIYMVEFLQFDERSHPKNNEFFYCPCVCCVISKKHGKEEILNHLFCDGIYQSYTRRVCHGEVIKTLNYNTHRGIWCRCGWSIRRYDVWYWRRFF